MLDFLFKVLVGFPVAVAFVIAVFLTACEAIGITD